MNAIGIMQGRLSPPMDGRIQSFPVQMWREEFSRAREAGLSHIEWVYEAETEAVNPLRSNDGIAEIRRLAELSGIAVTSICADYYMTKRLVADEWGRNGAVEHLSWLLRQAGLLGARYVVLPFVDASSLKSRHDVERLESILLASIPAAERSQVEMHLETDLAPNDVVAILETVCHPLVRANYDIGNSAALQHDPVEEFSLLGPWLGSVHVKDRLAGGGSVPLGTGAADFPTCFRLIAGTGFDGTFVLQAAREEGASELELAVRNRRFVERQLAAAGVAA